MSKIEGEVLEILKQALPELELDKAEGDITLEFINTKKGEVLIGRDLVQKQIDQALGKHKGSFETVARRLFGEEANGKGYDELFKMLEPSVSGLRERLNELEKGDPDKNSAKLKEEMRQLKELLDSANGEIGTYKSKVTELESKSKSDFEEMLTNHKLDKTFNSMAWVDNTSKFTKAGLWNEVTAKYSFKC